MRRAFFIDFDGTITLDDACFSMVNEFSRPGWEDINQLWEQGKLGTIECARRTFKLFDTNREELIRFVKQLPIDPYFQEFTNIIQKTGDEIYILSDGYDILIKAILEQNGIDNILFFSNELLYSNGEFDIECPHYNHECGHCGTCKTKIIKKHRKEGVQTIYIGDSTSDKCPVKYTDIVFAKKGLLKYCKNNNISAKDYHNFKDIIEWLKAQEC